LDDRPRSKGPQIGSEKYRLRDCLPNGSSGGYAFYVLLNQTFWQNAGARYRRAPIDEHYSAWVRKPNQAFSDQGVSNIMVMLSQLRRSKLTDEQGRQASLMDLSVALLDGGHPPVTRLYFLDSERQKQSLPWESVRSIDWSAGLIRVADIKAAQGESTGSMAKEVLLGDGILDALVLDLQNRRTTRANDLWLEPENLDGRTVEWGDCLRGVRTR
jgi:hypothetical protein